jgi:hypothetical protein
MRYVEFPVAQLVKVQNKPERELVSYATFLDDYVWADPRWRKTEETARARQRLIPLFDAALAVGKPGVGVPDKDFEKWEPIAALRDIQVAGDNVRQISVFTDAAMFASTKEPDWAKPPPDAKPPVAPSAEPPLLGQTGTE